MAATITSSETTPFSRTTFSLLPTIIPTTVTSVESTLSQNDFEFLHPIENPVVYEITPDRKESVKLNCTAFYNGSNEDITITWTSNERLIYTDTSFTEDYEITTVLKVAGKSQATFTCTFHHASGWSNSREFIFTANGKVALLIFTIHSVLINNYFYRRKQFR